MNNLQDKIAALKAGDYDVVLEGTKYDPMTYIHSDAYDECEYGVEKALKEQEYDAGLNAAKVIVLEEQVRMLREAGKEAETALNYYIDGGIRKEAGKRAHIILGEVLAATDMEE